MRNCFSANRFRRAEVACYTRSVMKRLTVMPILAGN
jgi:hypothetical protein